MIKNLSRGLAAAALAFAILAPASPAHADEYTLTDAITSLPIAEEIRDGCKRELYPHGKDDEKNGRSARNDVLIAEAIEAPTVGAGCTITGGVWHSSYDVLASGPAGTDMHHLIPLVELHDSGGYGWTTERRRRYANDLGSEVALVGVTARSNRQKFDQDPATWMPAPAVHCRYIGEWVATKHRWALVVDQTERADAHAGQLGHASHGPVIFHGSDYAA